MSNLRLIILIIGIVVIVVIYLWEIIKQRKSDRSHAFSRRRADQEISGIRIAPKQDEEQDYSEVISELNQSISDSKKQHEEEAAAVLLDDDEVFPEPGEKPETVSMPQTRDMFTDHENKLPAADTDSAGQDEISESSIITLHVTAMPTKVFTGNQILEAVKNVGLEYGEMNIFHHYGIGDMLSDRPLFSVTDMFEPGYFDMDSIKQLQTRGISLFFCLPVHVDGQVIFELMLNTAQRLAGQLGGEIRGADHMLINDNQIAEIREKINRLARVS